MGTPLLAQNQPDPEQLAKMLEDSTNQLKAAQDRKNELATENQKLQKRLAEVEQQSSELRSRLETLENRAFFLREHYAAWQQFVEMNPPIRAMWLGYFNATKNLPVSIDDLLGEGNWPFAIEGEH
jgi:predicted nuclease with TOPRIM domain